MRRLVAAGLLAFTVVACRGDKAQDKAPPSAEPAVTATRPPEDPCAKGKLEGALTWIHDDYAGALACAKQRGVPLVLDLWAPWCHTCLSMKSTVFTDPSFAAVAPKFVFAALDTDRDVNAPVVEKFALSAWPTFYVIGPDEAVLSRFIGAASVPQFQAFLAAGARALTGAAAGADTHLLASERALAVKDFATAETELVAALAAAPADWPRKPDALVALMSTKSKRGDHAGCVTIAEQAMGATGNAASASDFLYHAMTCADGLVAGDGEAGDARGRAKDPKRVARATKLRERAVARWQQLLADPAAQLSVDDRSDAMANLREALIVLGKPEQGKAIAEQQRRMLDEAAAKAANPMAAMTYNWPRAEVYVFLGRPLELVSALEKSAADLPSEYDPPARLGWIYLQAGKLPEAAKWTDQAVRLAYGPRKIRVLNQRAEIAAKQQDRSAERLFREEIIKTYEALPPGQAQPDALAKARQALADLDASAAGSGGAN
ncbi:MAG: thioredoxin family protein [Myxococcota bacterium]|nr:thioredoxin family protein [Myxococcota bacterium]